jgi:hypothetical protein
VTGSDSTTCCGIGNNGPCQTIDHAMELIDAAQARDVTINAAVNGGGGDWSAAEATHPIVLGWGVELSAPGVYFLDPNDPFGTGVAIFDVKNYSTNDQVGYASIVGTALDPVHVGFNAAGVQTIEQSTIQVETGNTLFIANASVNGNARLGTGTYAFYVAGGTLTFGGDHSGVKLGTVYIGNALGQSSIDGSRGIYCIGCTINDVSPGPGLSSVVIQGQEYSDIQAQDTCPLKSCGHLSVSITLTANPIIGVPPSRVGFTNCPAKQDGYGIAAVGQAEITFKNGTIQCLANAGVYLRESYAPVVDGGTPIVSIDNTIIQNTDIGIWATAGTATVTNTTINYNFYGVSQGTDGMNTGTIDLSGGGNTVACSSHKESSTGATFEGIDVYNSSALPLNASNVAWDTTSPDYFSCDSNSSTATCRCLAASCRANAPFDGMNAVTTEGGITMTGYTQSPNHCN